MSKILSILLAGSVVFTLAACQNSSGTPSNNDTVRPLYLGDLDKKLNEIYGKENEDMMNVCDKQWRPRILELAHVLEEKRAQIEELAKKKNSENNIIGTDFGPFKFIENTQEPAGKDEWTSYTISWSKILEAYDIIKDDPENPYWVSLNRLARGIVSDDEGRIAYGRFYGLTKDSESVILEIQKKILACKAQSSCTMPDLTSAEWNYLRDDYIYSYYYRRLRHSEDFTEKRKILDRFANRIQMNADRYTLRKEELVRIDGKTLIVPMDLSSLGDEGAQKFIALNEKAWNIDPEYSVKIEAVKDPNVRAYKVNVDNEIGGRAYVMWNEKTMQLYNWGRTKTIAHEFGHVIGLKDKYFTTWSTDTCSYTDQSNAGDLMSNSNSGAVLPLHWKQLKSIYWPASTVMPAPIQETTTPAPQSR